MTHRKAELKKRKKSSEKIAKEKATISMPVLNPNAAGIDIGGKSHYVCVSQENVEKFGAFTEDLHKIAKHLLFHNIKTVALESTGPYWKQLFLILRDYGLEVILVNARHLKNVKGHKTDVIDSKWIQLLHSIGLLSNSFLPGQFTEKLRTYTRQRGYLIKNSSKYISKMRKSLILMNIRLDNVLRDVTGKSGIAVIEAILSGQYNSEELLKLFDRRVKASREEIKKALKGDYREEYIFELKQSYELYKFIWEKIRECDNQIDKLLENHITSEEKRTGKKSIEYTVRNIKRDKNATTADVFSYSYKMTGGIELNAIPGVGAGTILSAISETGLDLKKDFKTAKHFVSWLRLAPNNKISGDRIISSSTPKQKNILSRAFMSAANTVESSKTPLGDFFRRLSYRKGRSVAIVATARKIATIFYIMVTTKKAYSYQHSIIRTLKLRKNQINNIKQKIKKLDILPEEIFALQYRET